MRLLDLFCKAGGAAMGYHRAGFEVVGVDIKHQKHFPFEFVQADAIEYVREHGREFDYIHASPPCQFYSCCTPTWAKNNHPDLIGTLREELLKIGKPYIIENVSGARNYLINPIMLCGSMFGLKLFRHRYFEINPPVIQFSPRCRHNFIPILISGTTRGRKQGTTRPETGEYTAQQCREASGLHWMTREEMDEAIPPVYTEWIGRYLLTGKMPDYPPTIGLGFF